MPESITLTKEGLQELLKAVLSENNKLNPIEQKQLEEQMQKEHRRSMLVVELGKQEEEKERRQKLGCSHRRDPETGDSVSKDSPIGQWTTGGQAYQNGLASIICTRCSTTWLFKPSPDYYAIILQNGLMRVAPPPAHQCYCYGCLEMKTQCRCEEIRKEQSKVA